VGDRAAARGAPEVVVIPRQSPPTAIWPGHPSSILSRSSHLHVRNLGALNERLAFRSLLSDSFSLPSGSVAASPATLDPWSSARPELAEMIAWNGYRCVLEKVTCGSNWDVTARAGHESSNHLPGGAP